MKISAKKLEKSKYILNVELTPKELQEHFNKQYEKLAPEVKIAGFRPGKAPRKLTEDALGQGKLLSESLDQALQNSYVGAIAQEKLTPVCPPKITILNYPSWGLTESEIKESLVFEAEFEVMPKVELCDYSTVAVKKREIAKIEEADVEKVILHLRRQKANFLEIERSAKKGDRVEISYEGKIKGVKKDAMTAKNHPLVLGDKTLIPGFEEEIVGMKKGEKKTFEITFPADYRAKEFAGEKAEFDLELIDLKEIKLPELDDQFAKNFGHENVGDLKAAVQKSLHTELEQKISQETETEMIEKLLPKLKVEIPESLIEQEIDRTVLGLEKQIKSRGLAFDRYLQSIKKTSEEFREEMKPTAERNVRIGFLLGKIIEEQNFDTKDPQAGRLALDYLKKKLVK